MHKKLLSFLSTVLLLMVGTLSGWAGVVSIPTACGSYISTAEATLTNCNSENDGKNIGSTYNGSTMTVSLNNATAGDYILQFMSGASGLTATVDLNVKGGGFDETQSFNIANTGSWTPSEVHAMELKNLPAGELTLKLTVTSTTGSYAGNYGSFVIQRPDDYFNLSMGTYSSSNCPIKNPSSQGGYKIGYLSNNVWNKYNFLVPEDGNYNLCMAMNRSNDGTMNVSICDYATGTEEVNQNITINSELCKGYGVEVPMEISSALTAGLKSIKLTFNTSGNFLMDYENVRITKAAQTITLINAVLNGGTNAPTVTGTYAGSAVAQTQGTPDASGGYKFDSGCYVGLTLDNGYSFKAGDVLHVNVTSRCTGGSKLALYSDLGTTLLGVTGIGQETGDLTFTLTDAFNGLSTFYLYRSDTYAWNGYVASVSVTGVEREQSLEFYNVNYSLGASGATGSVPAAISGANTFTKYLVPVNTTIYKEGYTLKGWTDGVNEYLIGQSYNMTEGTHALTPVFTQNTVTLAEADKALNIHWEFRTNQGAPAIGAEGNSAILVTQAEVKGETIDLCLNINATSGKFNNSNGDWAQVVNGTVLSFPSVEGATVSAYIMGDPGADTKLDGSSYTSYTSYMGSWVANPTAGISTLNVQGGSWYGYLDMRIVPALQYPLTVTWNFRTGTDQDYFTNPFGIEGRNGTVHSDVDGIDMEVLTNPGKFSTNGRTDWAQFNNGTRLHIPVGSTNDVVKVTTNGSQATVGGELITNGNEFTHRVVRSEAEAGYVEIVSMGGYLGKVQAILQGDNARDDRNVTVTYYDVDGTTILGAQVLQAGQTIGTYAYTANIPAGYTDNGWCDAVANDVATSKVVSADMAIYPYVTKVENGKYIIPAGNGRQLYNTLKKAAINSIFYIANGTYDLGTACRTELKNGYVLLGESRNGVRIINHPAGPGIQATSTLRITGDDVYLQNLTLRCDVSYSDSQTHGVGVALEINGTRSICNNVDLQCNQDTYYSNGANDQVGYFKGGRIEGTVDFICGGGNMWFEGTTLYCNQRYDGNSHQFNNASDVIAAPSTAAATVYGYVLNNCVIDGDACQANNYNLARPWQGSPAITWLNTKCVKNPSANAYINMSKDDLHIRFHEYNTVDANGTVITGHNLNAITASTPANKDEIYLDGVGNYTYANVLGRWNPEAIIAQYSDITITVGSALYSTFSAAVATNIPPRITAYAVTVKDASTVTLMEIDGGVIPANTGVVVKAEAADSYTFTKASPAGSASSVLTPVITATTVSAADYVLGNGDNGIGFYHLNDGKVVGANKAYLPASAFPAGARFVGFSFGNGSTTAVSGVVETKSPVVVRKFIKNGQLLIQTPNGLVNAAGVQVK